MSTITRSSIRVSALGGPEVLKLVSNESLFESSSSSSVLGPRQVVVKHLFAGLNMIDKYKREGLYEHKAFPYIVGDEGCGTVLQAGSEVPPEFQVGKRVAFMFTSPNQGSFTSHAIHELDNLIAFPKIFDEQNVPDADKFMASILIQGLTAHYLTHSCFNVTDKTEVVLLNAAAGGTGSLLSQIAKIRGAKKVIGICGGSEKAAIAKEIGKCDEVVDYHATSDWVKEVKRLAPGGVDVFYDSVGKTTFEQDCFSVLKRRGAMVTFGNASGPVTPLSPLTLTKYGSVSLQRPKLHDFVDRTNGELDGRLNDVATWIAEKKLTVSISKVFKLADAAQAASLLETGKSTGKILLDCQA